MAGCQSKRLRLEAPEITQVTYQCFICHATSYTCDMNTIQLSCCRNFVHKRCQERWLSQNANPTCGMCRASLERREYDGVNEAAQEMDLPTESVDFNEITQEVLAMSREQVVTRLRELLNSPELEAQLQRVSTPFFLKKLVTLQNHFKIFFQMQTTEIQALYGFRRIIETVRNTIERNWNTVRIVQFRLSQNYQELLNDATIFTVDLVPFLQILLN